MIRRSNVTPTIDRYFRKLDGTWGMIHLGCLDKVPKEQRDEVFKDAVRRNGTDDIPMEAPLHIGYPVVACSFCGITGPLKSWRENKWLVPDESI